MNFKRFLAALLLAAILLTGCTAAGTSSDTASKGVLTDWAYIEDKGELIVGMTLFAPMDYEDENGVLTGFEVEFGKAVAEKLGVDIKFQVINWTAKETELNAKNIDCIWNGMTIDEDRKSKMDISVAYMRNNQVLITKAENAGKYTDAASLKDAIVVAEQSSAGETVITTDPVFAQAKYISVEDQARALTEVASGTADAAVIDYVMSIGSIGEGTDYANITVVPNMAFAPEEYGIAFRKGSPETLAKVNAAIQQLASEGKLAEIARKYKLEDQLLVK